jgi:hypothetical protein
LFQFITIQDFVPSSHNMSTVDYQHKHLQAKGSDDGKPEPLLGVNASVEQTPPRIVTPTSQIPSLVNNDNNKSGSMVAPSPNFLHNPTVIKGIRSTYLSPLKPTQPNLRYSLSKGLEKLAPVATTSKESKSASHRLSSGTYHGHRNTPSSNTKLQTLDPNSIKIFVLLMQPKLKTFELIQLLYQPKDTTVGNLVGMIINNATEPALGNQVYIGLCRPKTTEEILNMEILASESHSGVISAKITLGEILVAIPEGYTGADVSVLAKQILSNPKIVKLLKRADPLAPKKSHRSSKRHRNSRHIRSKENVEVMEKCDEEDEIKQEQERKMKEAMAHAAQEAAAANAQIPGGGSISVGLGRAMSLASLEEKSVESSLQESIDDSFSSWSKSFDASFASSVGSGVSKRHVRRRERQVRRSRILKRAAVMAFIIMLALYFLDPRGYARSDEEKNELITASPMGMTGVFQCLFLLLTLYKIERYIRSSNDPEERTQGGALNHRCPFLVAANSAAKKLKSRYAKKFKKSISEGRFEENEQSLSRKLRSFSLKANMMHLHQHDDDTGSLR